MLKILFCLLLVATAAAEEVVYSVAWCGAGKYLISTASGRSLRLHDAATGKIRKSVKVPGQAAVYVPFGPDSGTDEENRLYVTGGGDFAVTCGVDQMLHWWKIPQLTSPLHKEINYELVGMSMAANGKLLAYTSTSSRYLDSEMVLLRWQDKGVEFGSFSELPPPDGSSSFSSPRLSPDGHWAMAFTGADVQLWNLTRPESGSQHLKDVSIGGTALAARHFYTQIPGGVSVRSYTNPEQSLRTFACQNPRAAGVDAREKRLVVLTWDNLYCWDLTRPEQAPRVWRHRAEFMQFSPDGGKVMLRSEKAIEVWSLQPHQLLFRWKLGS
ncbi:MAG: WD40 repeat domain-containing protein [Candidatus Eremiobacteraeota bacterium]|nr:WD40 repeat domain-containing protein [Candidatus Eremiobacteraeota bacterium]MCW5871440.1 WD40 repeat domain-containing protein [Candidatus Eremiobacteraeota bacterium]